MHNPEVASSIVGNLMVDSLLESKKYEFLAIQSQAKVSNAEFSYTYTLGRSDQRKPEVILTRPLTEEVAAKILNEAVAIAPPEAIEDVNYVFEMPSLIDQAPRRFKWMLLDFKTSRLIKNDLMPLLFERYSPQFIRGIEVYQLLFADANNRLPGEEGYNTALDQPILIAQ